MTQAYICDAIRTPFGRYGGALAAVRTDDLAAIPLRALRERNPGVNWEALEEVWMGCVNQAGEDNRNVARTGLLLAGLPVTVGGATVNRLCGSGLEALATAARAIRLGEVQLAIAGGVESMSRAPLVMGKPGSAYARDQQLQDTTLGWRFINPRLREQYGVESMAETAENVAKEYGVSRADQDRYALASQTKALAARGRGDFDVEIVPVTVPARKGEAVTVRLDEHPRATSLEALAGLRPVTRPDGSVTAGNASGINDGAGALLVAGESAVQAHGLKPLARVVATASAGVPPRVMGIGPAPAIEKVLALSGLSLAQIELIELNEAFAAQTLAVLRLLGLADDDARVNPLGGAIALGHPLGASGARIATSAVRQLQRSGGRYALCSMCIGVGQGIAVLIERV